MTALYSELLRAASDHGVRPAVWEVGTEPITFDRLRVEVDRRAAGLLALGLGPGAVVALDMPSGWRWIAARIAVDRVGGVAAGWSQRAGAAERTAMAEVLAADVVIDAETDDRLAATSTVGELPGPLAGPAEVHSIVFTSGTSGRPKAAVFGPAEVLSISDALETRDPTAAGQPTLVQIEMCNVGFATRLLGFLRQRRTLHVVTRWSPEVVLDAIEATHLHVVAGVPAQLLLMMTSPGFASRDLQHIQTVHLGGAPCDAGQATAIGEAFGAAVTIGWSSTEMGGVGTGTRPGARHELTTVGRPRPGVELRIGPEEEVLVRSPMAMRGYWRANAETARALDEDGWLHTGDLGELDADGLLHLHGRRDDRFIRGGYNIDPLEVEEALRHHELVSDVAVVPANDPTLGSYPVAVVVPAPGTDITLEDLRAEGRRSIAAHKLPESLVVVSSLPRTRSDKLDRRALRTLVERVPRGSSRGISR